MAAIAVLGLAGCMPGGETLPVQEPEQVSAAFVAALEACSAGLTPDGSIDQAAMAARGWRVVSRSTRLELENRQWPVDAYPALRPGEYEATRWERQGVADQIELIRSDPDPAGLRDICNIGGRAANRRGAERVVAAMADHFGRPADRRGEQPRGGDFLTPRFDRAQTAYYWALPRNDAYLLVGDGGHVRLEVRAMPDRAALDRYSPDHPEHRIPVEEGSR